MPERHELSFACAPCLAVKMFGRYEFSSHRPSVEVRSDMGPIYPLNQRRLDSGTCAALASLRAITGSLSAVR